MASRATSLEDEVEDGEWINCFDSPLKKYERLSRNERLKLLEQVRGGTVILKLDAKKMIVLLRMEALLLTLFFLEHLNRN